MKMKKVIPLLLLMLALSMALAWCNGAVDAQEPELTPWVFLPFVGSHPTETPPRPTPTPLPTSTPIRPTPTPLPLPLPLPKPQPAPAAPCVHVFYNETAKQPYGTELCWNEAYVEQVYQVLDAGGQPTGEGAIIVSVVHTDNKLDPSDDDWVPWYGPIWFECPDGTFGLERYQIISIKGIVLGEHALAGRYPEDGIRMPAMRAVAVWP